MTDRKQALQDLREKVAAGTPDKYDVFAGWPQAMNGEHMSAWGAYNGSIDAAKTLHDAVLPEQSIRIERRVGGWVVWLDNPHQGISDDPARAWLLAILSALIAQQSDTAKEAP